MSKNPKWRRETFSHGGHDVSISGAGMDNVFATPTNEVGASSVTIKDNTLHAEFTTWFGPPDVAKYGQFVAVPMTVEMGSYIGFTVVQAAAVQQKVRAHLEQLVAHNGTTLDWQLLSKYGAVVTRLQTEAALIAKQAPVGAKLMHDAAEKTRKLYRQRGNLAHGDIYTGIYDDGFHLIAVGKNGPEWFSEAELRDLALRLCRASYELRAALDPDDRGVQRASRETHFLRDFQASNPLSPPSPPTRPRQPRSSKR